MTHDSSSPSKLILVPESRTRNLDEELASCATGLSQNNLPSDGSSDVFSRQVLSSFVSCLAYV